jgi:hypothetical protein
MQKVIDYLASIDYIEDNISFLCEQPMLDGSQIRRIIRVSAVGLDNSERNGSAGREDYFATVVELHKTSALKVVDNLVHELLIERLAALDQRDIELLVDVGELLSRYVAYELPRLCDLRIVALQLHYAFVCARLEVFFLVEAFLSLFVEALQVADCWTFVHIMRKLLLRVFVNYI